MQDNIIKHAPVARLARKLVELDATAPINFDEIFEERKPEPLVEMDMSALDAKDDEDGDLAELIPGPKDQTPPPTFAGELVTPALKPEPKKSPGPSTARIRSLRVNWKRAAGVVRRRAMTSAVMLRGMGAGG